MGVRARIGVASLGVMLLVAGTLLGLAGFARDLSPGWEDLPSVQIYSSRPEIGATITMEVRREASDRAICDVFLRIDEEKVDDVVLVVSSKPSAQHNGDLDSRLVELSIPDAATGLRDVAYYYRYVSFGPRASNSNDARGFWIYAYDLGPWPRDLDERDFDFKMPTIGLFQP